MAILFQYTLDSFGGKSGLKTRELSIFQMC